MNKKINFNFGLYPVVSEEFCGGRNIIDVIKSIIKGSAKIIQLRQKNQNKKELYNLALKVRKITADHNVKLIINDHIDIALGVNADGVHLGQDDMPCDAAKKIAPNLIIGVSTHNFAEIKKAQADGATYINIGPIFATYTKTLSMKPLGLDYLKKAIKITKIPFTVMGGINKDNIKLVLECGARNIAMVTAITQAANVKKTTNEFVKIIEK